MDPIQNHPFSEKNETTDIRLILPEEEIELLRQSSGWKCRVDDQLSLTRLESILRRVYHMGDDRLQRMTWKEVIIFFRDYVANCCEVDRG